MEGRKVAAPTLVICAMADLDIYPSECRLSLDASAATDKELTELAWAGHYLTPIGAEGAALRDPRERVANDVILPWLRRRWAV